MGLIAGGGTVRGKPVAFARLRSTYFHEVDSAACFMDFNTPEVVRSPATFQRAANKIGYTFNWFYADSRHIAYFNSGANPVRAKRTSQDFPVRARFEWRGWNPDAWTARFAPFKRHPRVVDQRYLVNWNNKQARGFRASDTVMYSSTYRSVLLEDRVTRAIRGSRKLTPPKAIDIMEVAGTDDLRAHAVLPLALKVVGRPRDPELRAAVDTLRAWRRAGGLRKDADRSGVYDHSRYGSWTPGGRDWCARSSSPCWARPRSSSSRRRSTSTTRPTTTATTSGRPTRTAGTATSARTSGACSAVACADRTHGATAAPGRSSAAGAPCAARCGRR
jgi:hypothetical protein